MVELEALRGGAQNSSHDYLDQAKVCQISQLLTIKKNNHNNNNALVPGSCLLVLDHLYQNQLWFHCYTLMML